MTKNMGMIDRAFRLIAVVAIAAAFLLGKLSGTAAIILGVAAVAFFVTSLIGTCPAYLPFGRSTRSKN